MPFSKNTTPQFRYECDHRAEGVNPGSNGFLRWLHCHPVCSLPPWACESTRFRCFGRNNTRGADRPNIGFWTNSHMMFAAADHPTARLIGSREPLEMDFDRVLQAALKANIALEINGSMYRLDLNDSMARAAQDAGALLAIGSDAHSTAQLDQIRYGVFQARRGWVQARSVVNAWPWLKLGHWLRARTPSLRQVAQKLAGG